MNKATVIRPKVTVGMAVYNGEQFIRKRLESILSQTLTDFELIITDDSTDSTPIICEEFAKKDKRIRYIRQQKRMGWVWSYVFLVKQARGKYFVWAPVDDKWSNDFLEKNLNVLDTHKNVVGSISRVGRYGTSDNEFVQSSNDSVFRRTYKKIRQVFRPFGTYPLTGPYEKKARQCLRNMSPAGLYAVYRTNALRKSVNYKPVGSWDYITLLSVLEYGDLFVVDEVLLKYYMSGISSKGNITSYRNRQVRFIEIFFQSYYLILWCLNHFGVKFFLKNLDHFSWLIFYGLIGFLVDVVRLCKHQILRNEDFRSKI